MEATSSAPVNGSSSTKGDYTSKFKIEIVRAFGRREQFVAALRYEVPLTESSNLGIYSVGLTYVFK